MKHLNPPAKDQMTETKTGWYWMNEDEIFISFQKEGAPKLTDQEQDEETQKFFDKFGERRLLMLIDAKNAQPSTKEQRKKSDEILHKVVKALAIIIHNPFGRMVVNLYIGLSKPKYPMKMFKPSEVEKALEWLKKHKND